MIQWTVGGDDRGQGSDPMKNVRLITAGLLAAFLLFFDGCNRLLAAEGAAEAFSVVVLPDTQIYAWQHPEIFYAQTRWIAGSAAKYGIKYVLHLGDVVEHNTDKEWEIARRAFAALDGKVPYAFALGNHDIGPGGSGESRDTLFGKYFPLAEFSKWETFGGVYDREPDRADNSYHVFRAGGRRWLILALEFGPRDDVIRWAEAVIARHPEYPVILITHAYLDSDGRRYDRGLSDQPYPPYDSPLAGDRAGLNSGEDIWRKLVAKHPNTVMVISGHVCVSARLESKGQAGNVVHQILVDYQDQQRGGNGWLRMLRFSAGGQRVLVQDYSPVLDRWSEKPDRRFELDLDLPTQTRSPATAK
jgi:3',5'-cyclic AMP phosphodiesterase CpdA